MTSALARERRACLRSRARRSTWVAAATLVFAGAVGSGITYTPGWPGCRRPSSRPPWRGRRCRRCEGLWLNLRVLVVAEIGILVLGLAIATLRGAVFFPLRALATGYVDLFRGLPLLIVAYLTASGCPRCGCRACRPTSPCWGRRR